MFGKKFFTQVLLIVVFGSIIGIGTNVPLIKKFLKGEYNLSFVSSEEYPNIAFISLGEAESLFNARSALFVDSREAVLYDAGHILGAINIPYEGDDIDSLLKKIDYPREETLVIYCDGSECQSSILLAKLLHEFLFADIRVFFGGWRDWSEAGLPIEGKNVPE